MSRRDAQPALKNAEQRGLGHFPNKHFATQKVFLYRRKHCLLALRTVKLPFQSSRVIFLGRSPAEEHLPGIIQAKECMKKKKHISEEQHYLCENRKFLFQLGYTPVVSDMKKIVQKTAALSFPQMDVSRMGYGYCNNIYGQIRQKSLIFFVYL